MPPYKGNRQSRGDREDSQENSTTQTSRTRSTGISRTVTKGDKRSIASSTALHGGPVRLRSTATQTNMRRSTRQKKASRYLNANEFTTSVLPKTSKSRVSVSEDVMPKLPRGRPRKTTSILKVKINPVNRKTAQTSTEDTSPVSLSPRRTRSMSRSQSRSNSRTPSKRSQIDSLHIELTPSSAVKRTPKRQPYILSTALVESSSFVQVTPRTTTKRKRHSKSNETSSTKRTKQTFTSSSSDDSSKSKRITPKSKIVPQTPKTPTTNRSKSRIPLSAKRTSDSEKESSKFFFSDVEDTTLVNNTRSVPSSDSTIKARGRKPKSLNNTLNPNVSTPAKSKQKNTRMSKSMGHTPDKSMMTPTPIPPKEQASSNSSIVIKKLNKTNQTTSPTTTNPIVLDERFVTMRRGHPSRSKPKTHKQQIETSS